MWYLALRVVAIDVRVLTIRNDLLESPAIMQLSTVVRYFTRARWHPVCDFMLPCVATIYIWIAQ